MLVTGKDILGFDLLLGYDAIKALGCVLITQAGTVQFLEAPVCATLCINRPDLRVEFNWCQKIWTASWKWMDVEAPTKLWNSVTEYPVPTNFRITSEQEFDAWIKDGWLILYPNQKLGSSRGLIPLIAERCQPSTTVIGKEVAPAYQLPLCLPLGVRHTYWKSKNMHQGSKRDVRVEARHLKESSLRV